ncbi:MAG: hypothetical protein ACOYM8_01950 [Caulobacterales bacterium]|jgi:hypothetical protein
MTADFTDPHFAFVWPSYALLALVIAGLSIAAYLRLSHWARRAKADDEPGRSS